jgi:hypothetical protein
MAKLKPVHFLSLPALALVVPGLWFAMAYGGLPRLWSHHEHKLKSRRHPEIASYTSQGIPADPVNLRIRGDEATIDCAFDRAGWTRADPVSLWSGLEIGTSVLFHQPYPQAPVSPLYVADRAQDIAFQRDQGRSADQRHHVRFWRLGPNDWLGAATFDRGVGVSLFTLQITHHIGADVDGERDAVGALFEASGGRTTGSFPSGIPGGRWHRNGGGDRFRTDGQIRMVQIDRCPPR